FNRVRRGNILFAPQADVAAVVAFHLAPSGEGQQRFIEAVADKDIFQSVLIGVLQYRAQRFHARRAVVLGVVELAGAIGGQLGQKAGRVVIAVDALRFDRGRNFGEVVSKSQGEIAELAMLIAVEEVDDLLHAKGRAVDGTEDRPRKRQRKGH